MITPQEQNYNYYMQSDVSRYIGEWVAIMDMENSRNNQANSPDRGFTAKNNQTKEILCNMIIAHGKNVKIVAEKAQEFSKGKKFLLASIPDKEAMIF